MEKYTHVYTYTCIHAESDRQTQTWEIVPFSCIGSRISLIEESTYLGERVCVREGDRVNGWMSRKGKCEGRGVCEGVRTSK